MAKILSGKTNKKDTKIYQWIKEMVLDELKVAEVDTYIVWTPAYLSEKLIIPYDITRDVINDIIKESAYPKNFTVYRDGKYNGYKLHRRY